MTEFLEKANVPTPEPPEERDDDKTPIKIRMALFYDGTLNNRINIKEREGDTDTYQENRDQDGPNSYDNGRTNIAIMEPHAEETADGYDVFIKQYVAGHGALTLKKDSLRGYALGIGESGVANRAIEGIEKAGKLIFKNTEIDSNENYIQKLTIDVFGFSRGAATARYAIHLLFNGRLSGVDEDTGEVIYECEPIHSYLIGKGYDIKKEAVEVCFAGLYDTVLSYIGSQYFKFSSNILEQKAVARAKKTLHLAAADEHRKDFPLHNIKSAKCNGGEEYFLPGVHSDIGGSYNLANEKDLQAETDETKKVYMLTTDESLVILEGKHDVLEQDKVDLIKQGWYKSNEITVETRKIRKKRLGKIPYVDYTNILVVNRKNIRSAYCNIPLKIMAEYARKPDVSLKISGKLERRANRILASETDLQTLEGKIQNYIANTKDSKAEDWIGDKAPLNAVLKNLDIRHKHFHFSSKPGMGYAPRIVWDKTEKKYRRIRFEYDA